MAAIQKTHMSVTSLKAQHAIICSFWKSGKRATVNHRHLSGSFGQYNAIVSSNGSVMVQRISRRTTLDRDPGQGRPTELNTQELFNWRWTERAFRYDDHVDKLKEQNHSYFRRSCGSNTCRQLVWTHETDLAPRACVESARFGRSELSSWSIQFCVDFP